VDNARAATDPKIDSDAVAALTGKSTHGPRLGHFSRPADLKTDIGCRLEIRKLPSGRGQASYIGRDNYRHTAPTT
jgi:hypothetical protein